MSFVHVGEVVTGWAEPATLRTKTITTVDFEKTVVNSDVTIQAVVQVADMENINVDNIDYSLEYLQVHSVSPMDIGQFIVEGGVEYKIIRRNKYARYGYYEAVAEEVK